MARRTIGMLALVVLVAAACGTDEEPGGPTSSGSPSAIHNPAEVVPGSSYHPDIDPAGFVAVIDNPYLPLKPGTAMIYKGRSDGERERVEVTVTNQTKQIMGITATVVHDQVFVDGELAEDTFDWYAQDGFGNVWYLGEDTKEYEGGRVVSTEGSWEAGVDGSQPGIIMLADPQPGDRYRQEYYAGQAEDLAEVVSLDESVSVPYGPFVGVLQTEDSTPLEPKVLEHKFYARGVGVVFEEQVRGGQSTLELIEVKHTS
jgi:hypothetical protein